MWISGPSAQRKDYAKSSALNTTYSGGIARATDVLPLRQNTESMVQS
jgi:hypothetical protein